MEDANEDDLIMFEESKEIKDTIWEVWDLLNDKEIITKILLNSSLLDELEKIKSHTLLDLKENKPQDNKEHSAQTKDKTEKNGKYYLL